MHHSAGENEGGKEIKYTWKWHIPPPPNEVEEDKGDGGVGGEGAEVGEDVSPPMGRAPIAAIPAIGEIGRVEDVGKPIEHETAGLFETSSRNCLFGV